MFCLLSEIDGAPQAAPSWRSSTASGEVLAKPQRAERGGADLEGDRRACRRGRRRAFEAAFGTGWLVELLEGYGLRPAPGAPAAVQGDRLRAG